jgi:hypothetical protein
MLNTLYIGTDHGDVRIREDELASIGNADLKMLRISRADLHRCFAEGVVLMQRKNPADVRPVASEMLDGKWIVVLVRYSDYARVWYRVTLCENWDRIRF